MIVVALLLSSIAVASPTCARLSALQTTDAVARPVNHAFQNGERLPLLLSWIDSKGKQVHFGTIAPGAHISLETFVGHTFVLTDPKGRCRRTVLIDEISSGTYVGTSRYRSVAVRPGWHVFVDQALDPGAEPAKTALVTLSRLFEQTETALPPASLAQVRSTPIFLHDHAGPGGMFHPDPDWLVAHGRTVEMLNAIELSDAGMFVETVKVQPSAVLHELAHAYQARLSKQDRADIHATYRQAMESGLYRRVKRHDGSISDAYARNNAAEYFAELSEAYFGRNDFFPFTRSDLASYDPVGERLIARLWR
ncbi:hypothetical protein M0208_10770 [Sphingomonas sp. SUN019]|uniref:hypothetical protein n=1 Tax=Sphingomonas sp. SUN019 TaxID=2937788 RepID=UPI0021647DAA|nr:hypothetical protein [Sphingomonas sp. SUN019]UVO50976.1 hypothetical protein M0208_10770 [Sphingomonas sp. SUN019]